MSLTKHARIHAHVRERVRMHAQTLSSRNASSVCLFRPECVQCQLAKAAQSQLVRGI